MNLPAEQVERIEKSFDRRDIAPLSSEKETGLFLMYAMGDSLELIAEQTNIPKDVVALTALTYDWDTKVQDVRKFRNSDKVNEIQRELVNTLLLATYASVKKDLALVIAGKKEAREVALIPKTIDKLSQLMTLVSDINNPEAQAQASASAGALKSGGTVVQAQNVQIINNNEPESGAPIKTRAEKLREMREKNS
jgi:hypothetical protein